jgi:hypothetical protein
MGRRGYGRGRGFASCRPRHSNQRTCTVASVLMTDVITGQEFALTSPLGLLTQNGPGHSLYALVALGSQSKLAREARRMEAVVNSVFLSLGLVFFAFWIRVTFTRHLQRHHLLLCLGGLGIFALTLSACSPNDDLLQRDLIHSAARSANVAQHLRAVPRRPLGAISIDTPVAKAHWVSQPTTGETIVVDQRPHPLRILLAIPAPIHSPPLPC